MKNSIKKGSYFFYFLLIASYPLYATHLVKDLYKKREVDYRGVPISKRKLFVDGYCRESKLPNDLYFVVQCFVYDNNPRRYINKSLPLDLSNRDLTGFDFTGCKFTNTDLTDSNLTSVILTNTTCDYRDAFEKNLKKTKNSYQEKVCNDLLSIATFYPHLKNREKIDLLTIASGLFQLPLYEDEEAIIHFQYWSSFLLRVKERIDEPYRSNFYYSIESNIHDDIEKYWWKTNYPQNKISIHEKPPHNNLDQYVKDFDTGLTTYVLCFKENDSRRCYRWCIEQNFIRLKMMVKKQENLQEEICIIAHALSKIYQIKQNHQPYWYLYCQCRLIKLAKLVPKLEIDTGYSNSNLFTIDTKLLTESSFLD